MPTKLKTPSPSIEHIYHPPGFMLPVNRISLPKMSHSYFSTSEISLEDMSSLRNVSLDQPTQRLLARQLEVDRHLAWKQPAFRYKTKLGHFPKEAPPYLYIKRTDPLTKEVKIIPEMVYPVLANRIPVPRHELLEDDWRAYRCAIQNLYSQARKQLMPGDLLFEYNRLNEIVGRIVEKSSGKPPVQLMDRPRLSSIKMSSMLAQENTTTYKDRMSIPAGLLYRQFKGAGEKHIAPAKPASKQLPKTIFQDPFEYKFNTPEGMQQTTETYWDPDVIAGGPNQKDIFIYNEPDVIPVSCMAKNFHLPLTKRVEQIVTGQHRNALKKLRASEGAMQSKDFTIPPQVVPLMTLYENESEPQLPHALVHNMESYIKTLHQ
ncbi:hypothetical protein Bpfe_006255 [Biomphalaria pfeifferi]|uniref:Uncharacterized protein n=1 Tax=Biomphalaria pfeifferi TaxID=112525 RepID=A0AAD8FIF7_BIOPF|nr:hypothetical protein Bpfe_006255 [Biomphalaria pfeifferi]